jgi:antitoxin component of MazEF toxin-antitoxin module
LVTGCKFAGKPVAARKAIGYLGAVQAKIEKIGDGFGLLLPKELLDACGFGSEATVMLQDKTLIVSAGPRRAREGWAEALRTIPQQELDRDFAELQAFRETPDEWDATEWRWPGRDADEKV